MCGRTGIPLLAIFTLTFLLNCSLSMAGASSSISPDIKSRFDLPAETLDKALRDFAIQANCNISYDPAIVAGLQAPAIKGEFTVGGVLSHMLAGTKLRAVNVNADTIQIVETNSLPESTAADSAKAAALDLKNREERDLQEIVVTGSHIRGGSTASPVIEIGREEIDRSGYTSVADLMLSVPQNFGGGYNAATMVGNSQINRDADNPTGASVPNLRGLGAGSTLTLLDGHRMAAGLPGGGADISSIPIDAIERIEVVTDSASAIYGSDAVAGVVNVILKRNYNGAETSLSYGMPTDGGGAEKRASQLFGTHWDGGDVLVAYEHVQQNAIYANDRDFTSSAPEPNSLLPETKNNSATLSVTQELSAAASVFFDGLYVSRDVNHFESATQFIAPVEYPSTLRKYAVAGGLNFNLMRDWKATVFTNLAEDATDSNTIYLTRPSTTLESIERFLGTMRSVEANANGSIASLPSGSVRLAIGAGYRKEGFSDALGFTSSSLTNEAAGNRNIRYAFGELSIPLAQRSQRPGLNSLDLIVSGRNERYSDFGAKTVPKVGLVYAPTSSVKLRSTWGKAFRAPNLYDSDGIQQLVVLDLPSSSASTGSSPVFARFGGNQTLQPETATAWSIGADYSPAELGGFQASGTFFDIRYANRISSIANFFTALTDPLDAFFVTPSPSERLVQSVYDSYPPSQIFNVTGAPFDPSKIQAIVDTRMVNVASQRARGVDLNINYKINAGSGDGLLFLNGTYLDLTQQNTPESSEQTLSGLTFYPPKFRLRGGATWRLHSWTLTGTVNYLPRETNNQVTPFQSVDSWTTIDASLRFAPVLPGIFSGLRFGLAALNIFDRDPPFVALPASVAQGLNYDSANASPVGRLITLQVSKEW